MHYDPRGISAIEASDQIPHPYKWWSNVLPPEEGKASNAWGMPGGMSKLRFDWYVTVAGLCLQNCKRVAKLHLFHNEINDNHDKNLSQSRNEQMTKITYIHNIFYFLFSGQKKEKNGLTCGWFEVDSLLEVHLGSLLARVTLQLQKFSLEEVKLCLRREAYSSLTGEFTRWSSLWHGI